MPPRFLASIVAAALVCACAKPEPGDPPDPLLQDPSAGRVLGPGLGNHTWSEAELFAPAAFIDTDSGVPASDNPMRVFKPFGTNVAAMHNGFMLTLFASDSGFAGGGLLIYDVSDVREPVLVNRVFELFADGRDEGMQDIPRPETFDGITGDFREQHAIGFARHGDRDLALFHTALGIEIWDLTDTTEPIPVSRLDLPGVDGGDYVNVAWQASWQGSYAYVSGSEHGIWVVDTRDPEAPVLADRGGEPNPIPPGELGGFRVGPIFALGNQLVLSSMDTTGGYAVLDISEPAHPTLQSALTSGFDTFYSTCFTGTRIVGSVRGAGAEMTVHDVSDPFRIEPVGNRPQIDEQLYCGSQDQFVFQGNEHDFAKVDVSDPADFHEVGRGTLGRPDADHGQVTPFGNTLFVGNDHGTGSAFFPHQAEPDTTPPAVAATVPRDGAVHQGVNSRIGIAFTDAIDNTSLTPEAFAVREVGGAEVPGVFAVQNHLVGFAPDEPLERGATYEVVLAAGGVRDWAGNALADEIRFSFEVTALAGGDPGALGVELTPLDPVPVGQEVVLDAVLTGSATAELAWRLGDAEDWTPFGPETSIVHTFTDPGHVNLFVQATDGTQTVVDSTRLTVHRPVLGPPAIGSTVALDNGIAWVANRDNGTVSRVDATTQTLLEEIAVGDTPSGVAVDGSGDAWIAVSGEDRLVRASPGGAVQSWVLEHGAAPCAVVVDPSSGAVAITEFGTGDLVRFDATGTETDRVHLGRGICGLSRSPDGSYGVSELRGAADGGRIHRVDAGFAVLPTVSLALDDTTVDAEDRGRGVPGFLGSPGISPSGQRAWIPATQANTLRGQWRDGQDLTHESTVRAVLPQLDLWSGAEVSGERLDFNDRAGPMAAVTTPLGDYVFVALMGSNEVAIVDAYSGASVGAIASPGAAPRGLALSADGSVLVVHAWLDRQLAIYDVSGVLDGSSFSPTSLGAVPLVGAEALDPIALDGKRIFNDASDVRMSQDGYLSCASCHLDGHHDGLVWDFTQRGEGLRNTTDLRGRRGMGHGPVHWTANFDEIQDFENDIRGGFGGAGFMSDADFNTGTRSDPLGDPKAGISPELDALAVYVASLDAFPRSPFRDAAGGLTPEAQQGELLFGALGCDGCHGGPELTDSGVGLHDVGTLTAASGLRIGGPLTGLDTPTLRGVWDGGPWLHDGGATALNQVLVDFNAQDQHGVLSGLTVFELADLEAYLLELE